MLRDPLGIAYATVALVFAVLSTVAWRRRATSPVVARYLVVTMLGAGWWSVATALAVGTAEPWAAVGALAVYPGVGTVVLGFVYLSAAITDPEWTPSRRLTGWLLVVPVLVTVAAATNPLHQLLLRGPGTAELTGSADWEYGPLFWVHTAYSYGALAIGVGLIARGWWRAPAVFRSQRRSVLVAVLIPLAANVVKVFGGLEQITDPTPFAFAITGTVMAFSIFRQDLVTFSPVARELIIEQMSDAIIAISPAGRVLDLNAAAVDVVQTVGPRERVELVGTSARSLLGPELAGIRDEARDVTVDAGGRAVELHVRGSQLVDRQGRLLGSVLVARDVTAAKEQSRHLAEVNSQLVRQVETIDRLRTELVELANRDPLTSLHNRRFLVERFPVMLAEVQECDGTLAAVMVDVDRFKSVNDRYGHLVGDAVLVEVAHRLRAHAPAGALVTRWGGEEFFVALAGAGVDDGVRFAEAVRARFARDPVLVAGHRIECTISCGVAAFPEAGTTTNELFQAADTAVYAAKAAGRDAVRTHVGHRSHPAPPSTSPTRTWPPSARSPSSPASA
ncbi:diguanylate cyclase [Cellulomonas fimi]|uniref:Diguanylate cyclase n=1 Tax=Cellulomonas fimi TaxID=1708 RepID=A0A7Y0M0L8_CELFI|nr:histidine kinase N-terminal 7TM domain-containing protein [Cellulomonas fimi]NMR21335.1 diguanylate cyclase [Cellulomonas fimi]